jgi:N-acetylmuramoyl-L-alanine amidase
MSYRPYVIRQGDCTGSLGARFGVQADALWSHPKNSALAETRPNREVLAPGDILYVPDTEPTGLPIHAHASNRYRARVPTTTLSLVIREGGVALANERCSVIGAGPQPIDASTDGDGRLNLTLPLHVREITVIVVDRNLACPVRIGHLNPATENSGVRQRLAQLGRLPRFGLENGEDADDEIVRAALRRFQEEHGLEPSGENDAATAARLVLVHGS